MSSQSHGVSGTKGRNAFDIWQEFVRNSFSAVTSTGSGPISLRLSYERRQRLARPFARRTPTFALRIVE